MSLLTAQSECSMTWTKHDAYTSYCTVALEKKIYISGVLSIIDRRIIGKALECGLLIFRSADTTFIGTPTSDTIQIELWTVVGICQLQT